MGLHACLSDTFDRQKGKTPQDCAHRHCYTVRDSLAYSKAFGSANSRRLADATQTYELEEDYLNVSIEFNYNYCMSHGSTRPHCGAHEQTLQECCSKDRATCSEAHVRAQNKQAVISFNKSKPHDDSLTTRRST
eukprot:2359493-Amphidinium_carterae.1